MKGIILAGGKGTRMYPVTQAVSKQLLPVYDKPMIYYPMSVLLLAGIRDILLITDRASLGFYKSLFGNGGRLGVKISYKVQEEPRGIAESFIIGRDFIGDDGVCLILGDNIFYGQDLTAALSEARGMIESGESEAVIFGYMVKNPSDFGVVEFDGANKVISVEEKPSKPKSDYAIPGLYFYSGEVVKVASEIKPSARGELEITSVNEAFLKRGTLYCTQFGRGFAWLDTGTPERLLRASEFIETVQNNQGFYVSCLEEVAWRRGFITKEQLRAEGEKLAFSDYGKYILSL